MPFNYVKNYIYEDDFICLQKIGVNYTGFIIGIGYAYIENETILTSDNPFLGKYSLFNYGTIQVQKIDYSYQSILKSLEHTEAFERPLKALNQDNNDDNTKDIALSTLTSIAAITGGIEYNLSKKLDRFRPIRENNVSFMRKGSIVKDLKSGARYRGSTYRHNQALTLRYFGYASAVVGLYYSGKACYYGEISKQKFLSDVIFTGIGFCGLWGLAISTAYFILLNPVEHMPQQDYMINPYSDYNQTAKPDKTQFSNPFKPVY